MRISTYKYVHVSMCVHACERESVLNVLFSLIALCTSVAYLHVCIKLFIFNPLR